MLVLTSIWGVALLVRFPCTVPELRGKDGGCPLAVLEAAKKSHWRRVNQDLEKGAVFVS